MWNPRADAHSNMPLIIYFSCDWTQEGNALTLDAHIRLICWNVYVHIQYTVYP